MDRDFPESQGKHRSRLDWRAATRSAARHEQTDLAAQPHNAAMSSPSCAQSAAPTPSCPAPAPTAYGLSWSHRFHALGPAFASTCAAQPVQQPRWLGHNPALLSELGLPADWLDQPDALAIFSGNQACANGAPALASVYSGHQFGVWAGQLGDGRALLLGEAQTALGAMEFQLKGAGLTPYSRMGDGRAVLRSSLREFLASEAMHGLGIPTTRALCLTGSATPVQREELETAAVLTRLAPSFLRFGHLEHFAHHGLHGQLRQLADFIIAHYYPDCAQAAQPYASLLEQICLRSARLVAQWQAVGFCHGVLNTDNMSVLGLTLDYGPYQFLDGFDPDHVCNHSDTMGRYAYNRQPNVVLWNLYALGQALLPLTRDADASRAVLQGFGPTYQQALRLQMAAKLGLSDCSADDQSQLLQPLLQLLAQERVDYTIFWRRLSQGLPGSPGHQAVTALFRNPSAYTDWSCRYAQRIQQQDPAAIRQRMLASNPKYVLRNHLAEQAIRAAESGDQEPTRNLLRVLQSPYEEHPEYEALANFPPAWAADLTISCSS
jgi:uncharacterized protein YdiU (UPF0061 family)